MENKGDKLNAISLFSGIGGFELGIGDYCRTILYCEADPHAQAVLLSRMAEGAIDYAPICTDVKEITGEYIDIPISIIFGGFPCQDISCAGKGVGLEGERSGLFFEIVRLAKEIKPTFLFLENVSAIRTRGLDRVIQELTEIGYDCRWTMLSASDVGAKHKRERWFLLANSQRTDSRGGSVTNQTTDERWFSSTTGGAVVQSSDREACSNNSEQSRTDVANTYQGGLSEARTEQQATGITGEGLYLANTRSEGLQRSSTSRYLGSERQSCDKQLTRRCESEDRRPIESNLGRMVDGIPAFLDESLPEYLDSSYWQEEPQGISRVTEEKDQRVERIKRLGNAVVSLQVRTAFEYLLGKGQKS